MIYDCAIIGGGVAGLALSILLARENKTVILFEKEEYPFHKVCGEYISNESIPFLESLGVDFNNMDLPLITGLHLSSPSGISIKRQLDVGGKGLSRYELDNKLFLIAQAAGVIIRNIKVQAVHFKGAEFQVDFGNEYILARTAIGAYGKNANIDVQLGRRYKAESDKKLYIAVKYHIYTDFEKCFVEMHNFPGGYCGLSAIENDKVNLSYISKVINLKKHGSIAGMEKQVMYQNPFLKKYFSSATFIYPKPLTISHLYFGIKQPVTNNILMLGDAAGNIAPLSGNGMSMALLSAKLAFTSLTAYLDNEITLNEMCSNYYKIYYNTFSKRINIARQVHYLFGHSKATDLGFRLLKVFPGLIDIMGKNIHGESF